MSSRRNKAFILLEHDLYHGIPTQSDIKTKRKQVNFQFDIVGQYVCRYPYQARFTGDCRSATRQRLVLHSVIKITHKI